jgi:tRNA modification GTPase
MSGIFKPNTDTIFAMSSGSLPAGVAVVRLSGSAAFAVAEALTGAGPVNRRAELRTIRKRNGEPIDRGLMIGFQCPSSFTGEDVVEFHVHGSRAVIAALRMEFDQNGVREAEPGEFTRRAFVNGKMDLASAESLADLIEAETELQRRLAISNSQGEQRALYEGWQQRLSVARAMIEAELDFADEDDIPGSVSESAMRDIGILSADIERHVSGFRRAEIVKEGYRVVLLGAPNAGKSSLLNALARRDVAIVNEEAGTTRDLLDVALDLDGMKVIVTDTAGIREQAEKVEKEGINRALRRAGEADLVLWLKAPGGGEMPEGLPRGVMIETKSDTFEPDVARGDGLAISVATGEGLNELLDLLGEKARMAGNINGNVATQARQVEALRRCQIALGKALVPGLAPELQAEWMRQASDEIGRLVGYVGVEDLLDVVFSRFCIGK